MQHSILNNKRILAVDDEPDILDTLEELLEDFDGLEFDKATDHDIGYQLLRSWTYDVVILDIMGVRGLDLLNASVHLGFPTVMLTAHALSVDALKKAIQMGARAYIPKEKMSDIVSFLEDVLSLEHESSLKSMIHRLGDFFNMKFGSKWMESEKIFWRQVSEGEYLPDPVILKR